MAGFACLPRAMLESEISANYYGNARRLLAKADGLCESVPEISARLLFESEGLTFRRQVQIRDVGRVDFLIGRRLIVEVNGYSFHASREAWRKDMARLNAAQARGFDVLSFAPGGDLEQPGEGHRRNPCDPGLG
jgi:very-short-patch-repair endonuclease